MTTSPSIEPSIALRWLIAHTELLGTRVDEAAFAVLCASLSELVGHKAMFAAVGRISASDYKVLAAWNFGCPPDLFAGLARDGQISSQPTLARWLTTEQPLVLALDETDMSETSRLLSLHGLGSRAMHGVVDGAGSTASCFVFFGLTASDPHALSSALRLVVPFLHTALMRLCRLRGSQVLGTLTRRERQLLRLVSDGKTNPQIAHEWSRSVSTVRNLLHRLMGKMNVGSRAQLAALAIQMSILESGLPIPPFPPLI